jgi:hypothetical protein
MISSLLPTGVPEPSSTAEPPPKRFSAAAVEDWASTPEAVRAEVLRLERELTAGLKKHQGAAARDADLAHFYDRAAKGGTTLKEALSRYVDMEDMLRVDPDKGLQIICQNVGASLHEVAARVLRQTPEQAQSVADAMHDSVTSFAAMPEHSRFEELSEDITFLLESGRAKSLADAYMLAERLKPSARDSG